MANPRIEVEIGAKVDGLSTGVNQATSQLSKLENAVNKATPEINKLTRATSQYNSVGTDFARIIQDAPFGIIGVGNNITQLAGSFQTLKNQTGSTSQALKTAFASIFSGSNALILGISTLTTVFTVLQMKGFFKTEEAAKSLTEQLEDYRSKLETLKRLSIEGQSNASREIQNFQLLRAQAQNANIPLERRLEAVNQLQKNYPSYLGNLSKEQILTGNVGNAYSNLTKEIIATAKAKAFSDQISKNSLDTLSILVQEEERVLKIVEAREKLESIRASTSKATGQDLVALRQQEQIQQQRINELIKQQTDSASQRVKIEEQNQKLTAQIASQIDNGAKFTQTQLTAVKELKTSYDGIKRTIEDINKLPRIGLPRSGDRDALLARREELQAGGQVNQTGPEFINAQIEAVKAQGIFTKLPSQLSTFSDQYQEFANNTSELTTQLVDGFSTLGNQIAGSLNIGNDALKGFIATVLTNTPKIIAAIFKQAAAKKAASAGEIATNSQVAASEGIAVATKAANALGPVGLALLPVFIGGALALISGAFNKSGGGGGKVGSVGASGLGSATSFAGGGQGLPFNQNSVVVLETVVRGEDILFVSQQANNRINKG